MGLSASITRKDVHHPIIFVQCGPVRYRVNARQQAALRPFAHHVLVRPTGFRAPNLAAADYRRDRHRDAALQEHGYFMLRFLDEDLDQRLDDVLDAKAILPFAEAEDMLRDAWAEF